MDCDLVVQLHELAFWVAVVVLTAFLVVGLAAALHGVGEDSGGALEEGC